MNWDGSFWMRIIHKTYFPPDQIEIEIHGELDFYRAQTFLDQTLEVSDSTYLTIREIIATFKVVHLNLCHVYFLDCAAIRLLLNLTKGDETRSCFISALPSNPTARKIFIYTDTLTILPIKTCDRSNY